MIKLKKYDPSYMARCVNNEFRRKETLKLYREVLRTTKLFDWRDENGVVWGDILKMSAREEIESSKQEKDPEILARALVNARMALDDILQKYQKQQADVEEKIKQSIKSSSENDPLSLRNENFDQWRRKQIERQQKLRQQGSQIHLDKQ